ncbi:hypothetical protein MACH26_39320 [Planctobacterium marinum]|uniref:Phytase-like domain-containing protein n=1 Tax=Planctobacterium marinum TaxID=1631968 RepID=A0AA48HP72_9ALTE|nr:hypothetical protein MACH26_39320 [Planctobacterium marinum]
MQLRSYWLDDTQGGVLLDPQTSGLSVWRDELLVTIADGSAHSSQVLKLIVLDPKQNRVTHKYPIAVAPTVADSCFGEYMTERPDLEALVVDPHNDKVFYTVTEDASRYQLTQACAEQYKNSGATPYPTLLVRLELNADESAVTMTHVRPIQYTADMQVGNYPNDGIEGMTFGKGQTLYLALEKDAQYQARIFSVELKDSFWQSSDWAPVKDEQLLVPVFDEQVPHPINALTWYEDEQQAWIVAAARNDNELWLIDPDKRQETKRIKLAFLAETKSKDDACGNYEAMNNYSIEGVAAGSDVLWLVNDPWKQNYHKNIQCEANRARYEKMAPLMTKISWQNLLTKK